MLSETASFFSAATLAKDLFPNVCWPMDPLHYQLDSNAFSLIPKMLEDNEAFGSQLQTFTSAQIRFLVNDIIPLSKITFSVARKRRKFLCLERATIAE